MGCCCWFFFNYYLNYTVLSSICKSCFCLALPCNLEKKLKCQECLLVQISLIYVLSDYFQYFCERVDLHLVYETNVENMKACSKWEGRCRNCYVSNNLRENICRFLTGKKSLSVLK